MLCLCLTWHRPPNSAVPTKMYILDTPNRALFYAIQHAMQSKHASS
jgi:hypothetical protein